MQNVTLREVVNEWWAYKGTGPITPQVLAELAKAEAAVAYCESGDALNAALDDDELMLGERAWHDAVGRAQLANDLAWHEWNKARDAAAKFRLNQ